MEPTTNNVQEIILKANEVLRSGEGVDEIIKTLKDTLHSIEPSRDDYYEVLIKLSSVYKYNRSYSKAESILLSGIQNAKMYEKELRLADIYRTLSFIKLQQEDFVKARSYAKKALSIIKYVKGFKGSKNRANIYAVLGNIYFTTKEYEEALEYYEKALKEAEDIDYDERVITVKGDIANLYIETDRLDEAEEILISIKEKASEIHAKAVPQIFLRLARIEYQRDRLDEARELIGKAIKVSERKEWKRDLAEAREALARVYEKEGKYEEAKKEYSVSKKLFKEIGLDSKGN